MSEIKTVKKSLKERDRVARGMSADGHFRLAAVKNTKAVQVAQERHKLSPLVVVLLGRLMSGASLLSSLLKGEERITVEAMGAGPVGKICAEAIQVGEVRGYAQNPSAILDFTNPNFSLGDALGAGLLRVTKILYQNVEPVTGVVELVQGDVSTDLAYYLRQSEQIPSAVLLDVNIDDEGITTESGGILVQAMPGASEEEIVAMQESIRRLAPLHELLKSGYSPEEMLSILSPGSIIELESTPLDFFCRCSLDRFKSALISLGLQEITEMQEAGHNELVCQYCGEQYYLSAQDFEQMIRQLQAQNN